ncbi:MAG: glycoside hydrolase/phage tail family protein [Parvibaculum sp.]|uniref:baseplate multidomain protein megatron n=1 Tax=Parvibaculum sp. TaxID=2024848 RepID=UPI0032EE80A8
MATLVLSSAGSALGSALLPSGLSFFGTTISGAALGGALGLLAGSYVDAQLFGTSSHAEGPRLGDLHVMASSEGAAIPRVYGRARIGGQVIWATDYVEHRRTRSAGGGKGGGSSASVTEYSYSVSFAVALCEGEVTRIGRVWANGKPLSLGNLTWRLHRGGETQEADPLIEAMEGAAPAYRGTAYVVFEDMDVSPFGNRIPQLSFEVFRTLDTVEGLVRAVTMIPGAGEFVYDTVAMREILTEASSRQVNSHMASGATDFTAAMDELEAALPNARAVSLVVSWFGDDLRCGECTLRPKIEDRLRITRPGEWSVAGLTRASALEVSRVDGRPAYGGTPSDASVKRAIAELKARGLAIVFYPFVMMDIPADNMLPDPSGAGTQPAHPWRGRLTAVSDPAAEAAAFFGSETPGGGEWSYRRMVLHYAELCAEAGGVDAFLIGSELKGLTLLRDAEGNYPAVEALRELAGDVRAILGETAKISYAADWSEYRGHDMGGGAFAFHLDPLWADANIDFVGIDMYAPLSDWRDGHAHLDALEWGSIYDLDYLRSRIAGGESHDWYYASEDDRLNQIRTPVTDGAYGKPWVWRAKDLKNWWSNAHHDRPDGIEAAAPTAWVPQSKPIWLTELGCPAADKGTNEPNVFTDPKSSESALPRFSRGTRDDFIQRRFIEAEMSYWDADHPDHPAGANPVSPLYGGRMVDASRIFFWTWDARPFPVFPERHDVWADAANWRLGHWLNGRMGAAPLNALLASIASDAGFGHFEAADLHGVVEGYVIDRIMSPRAAIEPLMLAGFFDAAEREGAIRFRHLDDAPETALTPDMLAVDAEGAAPGWKLTRGQETELPVSAKLTYIDGGADYRQAAVEARRLAGGSQRVAASALPMVLTQAEAQAIADVWLQKTWEERERAALNLPPSLIALDPGDRVTLDLGYRQGRYRLTGIVDAGAREAAGIACEPSLFGAPEAPPRESSPATAPDWGTPLVIFMDLPLVTGEEVPHAPRVAVAADPWPGGIAIYKDGGAGLVLDAVVSVEATTGRTLSDLMPGPTSRWDESNALSVELVSGALASAEPLAVLDGANRAALETPEGDWEVIQFREAELVAPDTYVLRGLLRGQAGTEAAMRAPLAPGARFVLLDAAVGELGLGEAERGLERLWVYGPAPLPHDDLSYASETRAFAGAGLRPLSPVHLRARRAGDGAIHLAWVRRTRIGGDSWAGLEVPLGEEAEAYEVEIRDGEGVKRVIAAASPEAIYDAGEQAADFGGTEIETLDVTVYQLSRAFGRGTGRSATLHVG